MSDPLLQPALAAAPSWAAPLSAPPFCYPAWNAAANARQSKVPLLPRLSQLSMKRLTLAYQESKCSTVLLCTRDNDEPTVYQLPLTHENIAAVCHLGMLWVRMSTDGDSVRAVPGYDIAGIFNVPPYSCRWDVPAPRPGEPVLVGSLYAFFAPAPGDTGAYVRALGASSLGSLARLAEADVGRPGRYALHFGRERAGVFVRQLAHIADGQQQPLVASSVHAGGLVLPDGLLEMKAATIRSRGLTLPRLGRLSDRSVPRQSKRRRDDETESDEETHED